MIQRAALPDVSLVEDTFRESQKPQPDVLILILCRTVAGAFVDALRFKHGCVNKTIDVDRVDVKWARKLYPETDSSPCPR